MSKNRTFSYLCFLEKSSQKILFFDILHKKRMIFRPENWSFKRLKKSTFSKRVSPKIVFFFSHLCFCCTNYVRKDRFLIFWIKKNQFSTSNWSFKKSKKSTLSKGDNPWFLFKNRTFLIYFFFGENNSVKTFFLIFWIEKKWFLDQKIKDVKSAKNDIFLKG